MDRPSATTTADPAPPPLAPGRSVSLKPAAIVLGLATLVLLVFAGGAALFKAPAVKAPATHPQAVAGTSLRATGAVDALRPIISAGQPPGNVLNAVVVPSGARRLSHVDYSAGTGQYDEAVVFSVGGSQESVLDFYKTEMKRDGWQIESTGPADNQPGIEVLGQIAGDDGWYWEMGIVAEPSTFGASGTGATATQFSVRLTQEPDAD
jgi:hypothetical protein